MRIQSRRVWLGGQFVPAQIEIENGRICKVTPYGNAADEDYGSLRIVPGFIDIHTHGAFGVDTLDGSAGGLIFWAGGIPKEGVTAFVPTALSAPYGTLLKAAESVREAMRRREDGAEILGLHLEGPFLDPAHKGAHPAGALCAASVPFFDGLYDACGGHIRIVSLAAEQDPDFSFMRRISGRGVRVSLAHTGVSYEEALFAFSNGASCITHVFNAMGPFHHRRPGLPGAALRIRDVWGELIGDGIHVHAAAVNALFSARDGERLILVSDSLRVKHYEGKAPCCLGEELLRTGPLGGAYLAGTGVLAGSTLAMNQGLKFLVEEAMVPFAWALNSMSLAPAAYLGLSGRKGRIMAGADADLVALDGAYNVIQTWCRGKKML